MDEHEINPLLSEEEILREGDLVNEIKSSRAGAAMTRDEFTEWLTNFSSK